VSTKRTTGAKPAPAPKKATTDVFVDRLRTAYSSKAGWLDPTLPDLQNLLASHPEIDAPAFLQWLGERMAIYRANATMVENDTRPQHEREYVERMQAQVRDLRHLLSSSVVPTASECDLALYYRRWRDEQWHDVAKRLRDDLRHLALALASIDLNGEHYVGKAGRPSMALRDSLLADVVQTLRDAPMKADPARAIAAEILDRCGVPVPLVKRADNTRAVRRAASKGGPK
jgi:hypothetical protein